MLSLTGYMGVFEIGAELEAQLAREERLATEREIDILRERIACLEARIHILENGIYVGERL